MTDMEEKNREEKEEEEGVSREEQLLLKMVYLLEDENRNSRRASKISIYTALIPINVAAFAIILSVKDQIHSMAELAIVATVIVTAFVFEIAILFIIGKW